MCPEPPVGPAAAWGYEEAAPGRDAASGAGPGRISRASAAHQPRMSRPSTAHQPEAVAAVHRSCAGRPERDLGLLAAPGACRVEELAWTARVSTAAPAGAVARPAGRPPLCAARRAPLGLGAESLLSEELLLRRGEDEIDATVRALK